MSRIGILPLLTAFAGLIVTPLAMIVGYAYAAPYVAAIFRITDMGADYTSGLIAALILLVFIIVWPVPSVHRWILASLWMIRIGVALGFMPIYEAYYANLDAIRYYQTGIFLNDPFSLFEFGEGTLNIIALVGVLSTLTDSYSAIKVIFSYVGLIAVYLFYRAAAVSIGGDKVVLLYALGLFPSLLFWSSTLGKEPIVLLGIAIYCYGVTSLLVNKNVMMFFVALMGALIASYIRFWLAPVFFAPLIFTYVLRSKASFMEKLCFLALAGPTLLISLQTFTEGFGLETTRDIVVAADRLSEAWARGGSAQSLDAGFSSLWSMLVFMPLGAFTALFRPLPFEVLNPFGFMAGLENSYLLILFLIGLSRRGFGWLRNPILLWATLLLIIWASIYGFVSYQNLGTAFRFRAQVVPILLMLVLYLTYSHRLRTRTSPRSEPEATPTREQTVSS